MNGELGCRDTRGAMGRANEVTVIVLRKPDCGRHVDNGEAFRLVRPLFETNGLDVGDFANFANGFLFSIRPRTESWNGTERDAIMAGLSCLGSLGFSGYIAQKVPEDEVPIDACAVTLGVVALVAGTAVVAGGILAGMKGIRAIGRHLFARRLA